MRRKLPLVSAVVAAVLPFALGSDPAAAGGSRIKDLAEIGGVRENQLSGMGVVVGLNGTGDGGPFLAQALANIFKKSGLNIAADQARAKNAAIVIVTAVLPPFARQGSKIDITASSVGDAKSLQGGTLLRTPLEGADGNVYAVAQGSLAVGGFSFGGDAASAVKNHPTVGRIPSGAIVEAEVPAPPLGSGGELAVTLREPSFATSERVARAICESIPVAAVAEDAATVRISVPDDLREKGLLVSLVARIGELEVEPDVAARIVINERTGTIVAGERVRVSRVAIAHGNLSVTVGETPQVSQPRPLSGGTTQVVPRTSLQVNEQNRAMRVLDETVTVADLAQALNALGVTPRDLVAIFQALKAAGALQAELVVI